MRYTLYVLYSLHEMCVAVSSCDKASTCLAQAEALVVFHVYTSRLLMTHIGNNTNRQYTNHYSHLCIVDLCYFLCILSICIISYVLHRK